MHRPKLLTALAFLSVPVASPACGPEFEDCTASRTCKPAGAAGSAGMAGTASAAGSGGTAGTAGTAATGGSSGTTGGTAGGLGASGEGGEQAGLGGGGSSAGGSGGTSGSSTDAGEGGEAGRPEPAECERDENCNDGSFCNGRETCTEGLCADASEPFTCENQDAVHCSVKCEEGDGEAVCVVEALDVDEDEHTSAQCAAAPGNDCDDANDQIHPNATEACDGLDNDCDGLLDLDDGLELAGQTRQYDGIKDLDMAWIPGEPGVQGDEQFRLALTQNGFSGIRSAALDGSGALGQEVSQLSTMNDNTHEFPRLAGGTTTFGLTYRDNGRAGPRQDAAQANSNGVPSFTTGFGSGGVDAGNADIARRASAEWLLANADSQGVRIYRYGDNGSVVDGPQVTFTGQSTYSSWVRIATRGDASAVVWQVAPNLLRWARLNSDLVATDGATFGATGYRPDIVAAGTGYAMAWAAGSGIGFMRVGTDGAKLCEKGLVPLGLDEASDSRRVALADSELGTMALVTSAAGEVVLVRFGLDCQPSIVPVANTANASSPAIAVGDGSIALAWVDTTTVNPKAYTRLVGQRLCE